MLCSFHNPLRSVKFTRFSFLMLLLFAGKNGAAPPWIDAGDSCRVDPFTHAISGWIHVRAIGLLDR